MPNWCYNNMKITGKSVHLRKFVSDITIQVTEEKIKSDGTTEKCEVKHLSISDLYPCPEELRKYSAPFTGRISGESTSKELTGDDLEKLRNYLMSAYGASDWYEWCCSHWGTKWGDTDTDLTSHPFDHSNPEGQLDEISDSDTEITLSYQTAWSPATGLVTHISELYPNLIFQVVSTEESEMFAVWEVVHNGTIIGEGSGDCEIPAEIGNLYESENEDTHDLYYEALSEWQNERTDKLINEAEKCVEQYLNGIQKRRSKVEYEYKVRMVNLIDERDKALSQFDANEVILDDLEPSSPTN